MKQDYNPQFEREEKIWITALQDAFGTLRLKLKYAARILFVLSAGEFSYLVITSSKVVSG